MSDLLKPERHEVHVRQDILHLEALNGSKEKDVDDDGDVGNDDDVNDNKGRDQSLRLI